jgi:hypothetical protein
MLTTGMTKFLLTAITAALLIFPVPLPAEAQLAMPFSECHNNAGIKRGPQKVRVAAIPSGGSSGDLSVDVQIEDGSFGAHHQVIHAKYGTEMDVLVDPSDCENIFTTEVVRVNETECEACRNHIIARQFQYTRDTRVYGKPDGTYGPFTFKPILIYLPEKHILQYPPRSQNVSLAEHRGVVFHFVKASIAKASLLDEGE